MSLVGVAEVAELFGCLGRRHRTGASGTEFPKPRASLKSGPVWELPHILAWADKHGMHVKAGSAAALEMRRTIPVLCRRSPCDMKGGVGSQR